MSSCHRPGIMSESRESRSSSRPGYPWYVIESVPRTRREPESHRLAAGRSLRGSRRILSPGPAAPRWRHHPTGTVNCQPVGTGPTPTETRDRLTGTCRRHSRPSGRPGPVQALASLRLRLRLSHSEALPPSDRRRPARPRAPRPGRLIPGRARLGVTGAGRPGPLAPDHASACPADWCRRARRAAVVSPETVPVTQAARNESDAGTGGRTVRRTGGPRGGGFNSS